MPWRFVVTEAFSNGELPIWNPFINSGFTQFGDLGTWYPITILLGYFFRYNIYILHFDFLLHIFIAGYCMFKYVEFKKFSSIIAIILAVSYMLSGFFIGNAQHLGWLVAAAWFPLALLYLESLVDKENLITTVKLALVMFLIFTGGYPGMFISIIYLLFFVCGIKLYKKQKNNISIQKNFIFILLSVILFSLIAFVAIISTFDFAPFINRGEGLSFNNKLNGVTAGSIPIVSVLSFIFPFIFSKNLVEFWQADFSMLNIYFGVFTFFVLIFFNFKKDIPKEIRLNTLLGLLFLTLAMGTVFPFRKWISILPLLNLFKFPALFRIFTIFYFLLALGYALKELFDSAILQKKFVQFLAYVFIGLLGLAIFLALRIEKDLLINPFNNWTAFILDSSLSEKVILQSAVHLILLGVFLLLYFTIKSKISFKVLFFFLITLDIIIASQMNFYATVAEKISPSKLNSKINELPMGYPIPSLKLKLSEINDPNLSGELPMLWRNIPQMYKIPSPYGYTPYFFKTTIKAQNNGLYDEVINNPLLFLTDVTDDYKIDTSRIDKLSYKKINIISFSPNKLESTVTTKKDIYLIFLQNYYHYWKSYVDNKPQEIIKVNDTFMAIKIPSGHHTVRFEFYSQKIKIAFYISVFALSMVCLWLLFLALKKLYGKNRLYFFFVVLCFTAILLILFGAKYIRLRNTVDYSAINQLMNKNQDKSTLFILQVDNPSKINTASNVVFINDNLKNKVDNSISSINYDAYKTICFVSFNKIYRSSIYTNLSTVFNSELDFQTAPGFTYFKLSKSKINKPRPLFLNNFEKKDLVAWNITPHEIDSFNYFSANHSLHIVKGIEFGPTIIFKANELKVTETSLTINITTLNVTNEAYLVIDVSRANKNILWKSSLIKQNDSIETWTNTSLTLNLAHEINLLPNDVIKIYIWNKSLSPFYLDDFKISSQ